MLESLAMMAMTTAPPAAALDSGSTAWMLTSSALVLLMVPGLALFYGGMVQKKNVLTTMMHSFVAMALIGVQWIFCGYAIAFGKDLGGLLGWNPDYLMLHGLPYTKTYADKAIPELVFVMFQGKFAIITPALISGAVAERMRFKTYVVFILVWSTLIYDPLAHWVWAPGGWLLERGVLDFAGGTVVHISSGVSALALALLLGRRQDYPHEAIRPNSLVLTLTGAGLLWFGWFGFNAGSAVGSEVPVSGYLAGLAFTNTQTAAASAGLGWMLIEWRQHKKPTSLGLASGIVVGMVAITPAAGHVQPAWAMFIGASASLVCFGGVQLKGVLGYDDSLDAFGIHGLGGIFGALLTGVFCVTPVLGVVSGHFAQLGKQALGVGAAVAYSFVGTLLIGLLLQRTMGLRASPQQEQDGLDITVHGESGYHLDR